MPPGPFLTSAGWSLDGLISRGSRFLKIPRIPVSDKNLEVTIRAHESSGVPLVIEGMHEHRAWPATIFNTQWLCENVQQQIQVRNVHNRRDLDVSFAEFMDHIESMEPYASADETVRWYAKDMNCPSEWKRWLESVSLVPHWLRPHSPADIMQNLPECAHVETLMCYLGQGDTFTPFHKDLCASFGHNLMCYTGNGASAFWFMTETSDALTMAKYLQSLGHELDLECHAMSVEELAAAPCTVYITEQKAGDLVLVPPRSCHQVVNHGGLSMKMSWSRMSIKSAQIALHLELPIYRRVCRAETYRVKSTIHHTLRRNTALLEDLARTNDGSVGHYSILRKQLANDVQVSLELFLEIIQDEYHPDADVLGLVVNDFNHNIYDTGGYPAFICDFCGSDIFVSFFCCKGCSLSAKNSSGVGGGLHICPGCYAEGRSCRCGKPMDPVQCWPLRILYADYNRAVRALESAGVDKFREIRDHTRTTDNGVMGLFEAGTAIQKWRTEIAGLVSDTGKDKESQCHARSMPHAAPAVIRCKQCCQSLCFAHLAQAGIHSSEAIAIYNNTSDPLPWHAVHLSRKKVSNRKSILAAEASDDGFSNLMRPKLALAALSFPHCQPLNGSHIRLGWYDRPKPNTMAAPYLSDPMDMSHPHDGNGWGSPLTEIDPEDSVSTATLVRAGTPPRVDSDSRKPSGLQPSFAAATETLKRKRPLVFDGVSPPRAPPERKRKVQTISRHAQTSPSPAPPPAPVTSRNEEAVQTTQPTSILDSTLVLTNTKIEGLTLALDEQNKINEKLVQNYIDLRDELSNLNRTFQLSKRDLQRVENTIPKLTTELKTKFEKMLEKTESRIQGPIDRLLEELGRIRASPPTPVHASSITTYPQNTQHPPEPQTGGEGSWAPQEDYNPPGHNKQHYQENCEQPVQPHSQNNNNNYGRGGYRPLRGRGRGPRGGYSGIRHNAFYPHYPPLPEGYGIVRLAPQASTSAAVPLEQVPTPVLTPAIALAPAPSAPAPAPIPVPVATPRRGDSYHSQGPPPSQHSHSYPQSHAHAHSHPAPPTHYDVDPPAPPQRHRPARIHTRECEASPPLPSPAPRGTFVDRGAPTRAPVEYREERPAPARPRSRSPVERRDGRTRSYVEYRDDEPRPRARSEAAAAAVADDAYHDNDGGGRYADDSPAGYSPVRSDEQPQQRWASPSVSPSEHAVPHRHRHHHDHRQQQRQQRRGAWVQGNNSRSRSTSPSRSFARRGPGDDVRGGRR